MHLFKFKFLIWMFTLSAGLWLAACKTTPTPSPPVPQTPETSKTQETQPSTSAPSPESAKSEAQGKSETGRVSAPETAPSQKQEPKEKPQNRQTASGEADETRPPEIKQPSSNGREATAQTAAAKLAKARDDLRVSQATEKRIASELEALKKSGNASDEDVRNYEAYLERVRAMVAENRQTVNKMESAYSQHPPGQKSSAETEAAKQPEGPDQPIPEEQTREPVAELDRQLSASLSEFDSMLLKEMESIEAESAAKMRDLAQEAAEAAKRLKQKGVDLGTTESESSKEASEQGGESPQGKASEKDASREEKGSESQKGDNNDTVATAGRPKGEGSGPGPDRGSRYSKEDDDIVARQLREAAENETDPELKEKLWKEYEEYKKNTQQ